MASFVYFRLSLPQRDWKCLTKIQYDFKKRKKKKKSKTEMNQEGKQQKFESWVTAQKYLSPTGKDTPKKFQTPPCGVWVGNTLLRLRGQVTCHTSLSFHFEDSSAMCTAVSRLQASLMSWCQMALSWGEAGGWSPPQPRPRRRARAGGENVSF